MNRFPSDTTKEIILAQKEIILPPKEWLILPTKKNIVLPTATNTILAPNIIIPKTQSENGSFFKPGRQEDGSIYDFNGTRYSPEFQREIQNTVASLPISQMKQEVRQCVNNIVYWNKKVLTIVQGATGSGKTTQFPKEIHKELLMRGERNALIITEPRIVAAIQASTRFSIERLMETGNPNYTNGYINGYRTGREQCSRPITQVLHVTEGVALNRWIISQIIPNILIIDETHEYHIETEELLAYVKKLIQANGNNFKIVLMSATLNGSELIDFYQKECDEIQMLQVPGRTFWVDHQVRSTEEFIPTILERAVEKENMLVFLEGKKEITEVETTLRSRLNNTEYEICILHAEIDAVTRNHLFTAPSDSKKRIILCTNIGESSVTFDYIDTTISRAQHKIREMDRDGVAHIKTETTSLANEKQRAGRVGRTHPGKAFITNSAFLDVFEGKNANEMTKIAEDYIAEGKELPISLYPKPAISRQTLEREVLLFALAGRNIRREIKNAPKNDPIFLHAPNNTLLDKTYENLYFLGAITEDEKITELGQELLRIPLEAPTARILYEATSLGCEKDVIPMCAIIDEKGFLGKDERWKEIIAKVSKLPAHKIPLSSDLFAHAKLFSLITSFELDEPTLGAFKAAGADSARVDAFARSGGVARFFEVVDLEFLGVKNKKVYDILRISDTLNDRIEAIKSDKLSPLYKEEEPKETKPLKVSRRKKLMNNNNEVVIKKRGELKKEHEEKILRCIVVGLGKNMYSLKKENFIKTASDGKKSKETRLSFSTENIKNQSFSPANTSFGVIRGKNVRLSENDIYAGIPFIIDSADNARESTAILQFVTAIPPALVEEITMDAQEKIYSDITFGLPQRVKKGQKAGNQQRLVGVDMEVRCGGSRLRKEFKHLTEQEAIPVLVQSFLPELLVNQNKKICKWIALSEKESGEKIDIDRLKVLLQDILKYQTHRIDIKSLEKTENSFINDTNILESFLTSQDKKIRAFLANPFIDRDDNKILN